MCSKTKIQVPQWLEVEGEKKAPDKEEREEMVVEKSEKQGE